MQTKAQFEQVQRSRLDTFMRCFNQTVEAIDKIYKVSLLQKKKKKKWSIILFYFNYSLSYLLQQLCGCDSAQAILIAENPEEPYLAGIRYDCIPPKKHFISGHAESLSGGEMTLAAMSLLFAIRRLITDQIIFFP